MKLGDEYVGDHCLNLRLFHNKKKKFSSLKKHQANDFTDFPNIAEWLNFMQTIPGN